MAAVAALGLATTACEELSLGSKPDAQSEVDAALAPYYYVMIVDKTSDTSSMSETNGVDIDALALNAAGLVHYAAHVDYISIGSGESSFQDPSEALGAPEGTCEIADGNFVSLGAIGGAGGHLIVSFMAADGGLLEIETGQTLQVHECQFGSSDDDMYDAYVGTHLDPESGNWHAVIAEGRATVIGTVGDLPPILLD